MKNWIKGMRDVFFSALYEVAKKDKKIILISSDTGAICLDDFKKHMPNQIVNVGIAEQNMIGLAAGLAMMGKVVYCYAIIPFITMRCFEQIRVDICCMNLNVNLVGIGAGFDYSTLGPTHHGIEDIALMRVLPGLSVLSPSDSVMAGKMAKFSARIPGPKYIRLDRTGTPFIHNRKDLKISDGLKEIYRGRDLLIISTGRMVRDAVEVAKGLSGQGISAGVIDLYSLKPVNTKLLIQKLKKYRCVATMEEHFVSGGLGSIILEVLNKTKVEKRMLRIGIENNFCRVYGKREYLLGNNNLSKADIKNRLIGWTKQYTNR